ncbi:MAG: orotate phosphoribosyltransferase [Methanomassiliicoccales archaeon]
MNARVKESLKNGGALTYGDFVLSSGKRSPYYIDIKKASTDPAVLAVIAQEMSRMLSTAGVRFDKIAGVVLGSIPLAVALSLETKVPYVMVRREKRDHGTGKPIEGALDKEERVLVVEDVITSAGSVADSITILRNEGAVVETVLAVIDRQEGGMEKLKEMNVRLLSLLTARDLLGA